jgi:hypothetical protein
MQHDANALQLQSWSTTGTLEMFIGTGATGRLGALSPMMRGAFVAYTYDGTNDLLYLNGQLSQWSTDTPAFADAAGGAFGGFAPSGAATQQFVGEMQDCFTANTALTATQIWALEVGAAVPQQ